MPSELVRDGLWQHTCRREGCGHTWYSKLEKPVVCARCHSYNWDVVPAAAAGVKEMVQRRTTNG